MEKNESIERDKKILKLYVLITIGVSFLIQLAYIIFNKVTGGENGFFIVAIMWVPAITAMAFSIKYYNRIAMLGVTIGRAKPLFMGLFIPLIYLVLSYLLSWIILGDKTIGFTVLAGRLGWHAESGDLPIFFILKHVMVGILPSCAGAFGQEVGWRGFMYPVLEKVEGRKKAIWISGGIFALWHLPLVIFGLYSVDTVLWYGVLMFMIYSTLLGVILAWLRSISDSILPPLFVIASSNLFGQMILHDLSTSEKVPYLAGQTGIITIIFMAITVFIGLKLWKKRDEKVQSGEIFSALKKN